MSDRRTVGRLREKFEGDRNSPAQRGRLSLPASRFTQQLRPAEPDASDGLRNCKSGSSLSQTRPDQNRYSRVAETVKQFESSDPGEPVKLRHGPGRREFTRRTEGPHQQSSQQRNLEVTSNPSANRFAAGYGSSTTRHTVVASAARPSAADRLQYDPRREKEEESVYDNPAVNEDGEEIIVLRMKEEERAFDRRTRYQSVFKEVPLYQTYSKDVIRRESVKARARHARYIDSDPVMREHDAERSPYRDLPFVLDDIPAIDESPVSSVSGDQERPPSHTAFPGAADNEAGNSREPVSVASNAVFEEEEEAEKNHEPLTRMLAGTGPQRTFWADMEEVKRSGILQGIDDGERNLTELMFEVITSEASYFRSLDILVCEFYKAPEFDPSNGPEAVLSAMQKVHLFSNILRISEMSENFLTDLEAVWQRSPTVLDEVITIITKHAEKHFKDYVPYIRNQIYMNKAFAQLDTNERFKEAVSKIQKKAECGSIWDFRSFILLPMQRVTRLKLLVDKMLESMTKHGVPESDPRFVQAMKALAALMKVLSEAENEQDMMTQKERLLALSSQLDWSTVKSVSVSNKKLVKEGKLRLLYAEKSVKKRGIFSSNRPVFYYLFLFNDLLIVTKLKCRQNSNVPSYCVVDHCRRGAITAKPYPADSSSRFPFELHLLENHCNGSEKFRLDADTDTERERWLSVLYPAYNRDETQDHVYDDWDCPQVLVTRSYNARQPDELNLKDGELYSVNRKTNDGWYFGMGTTGKSGWFPASHTVEVENDHVRYRLLRNLAMVSHTSSSSGSRKNSVQLPSSRTSTPATPTSPPSSMAARYSKR